MAVNPEDYGLPPYPEGEVVGPCVCGSWPGGKCLRCPVIRRVVLPGIVTDEMVAAFKTRFHSVSTVTHGYDDAIRTALEAAAAVLREALAKEAESYAARFEGHPSDESMAGYERGWHDCAKNLAEWFRTGAAR